jgi:hypothetical protein
LWQLPVVRENNFPIGCASFKKYSEDDAEIMRMSR